MMDSQEDLKEINHIAIKWHRQECLQRQEIQEQASFPT